MRFFVWLRHRKWLMLFFLRFQRDNQQNVLSMSSAKGKTGEKSYTFHHVVVMEQPHTMTEPKNIRLCHRKRLMLYLLKFQRDNQ